MNNSKNLDFINLSINILNKSGVECLCIDDITNKTIPRDILIDNEKEISQWIYYDIR